MIMAPGYGSTRSFSPCELRHRPWQLARSDPSEVDATRRQVWAQVAKRRIAYVHSEQINGRCHQAAAKGVNLQCAKRAHDRTASLNRALHPV